MFRSSPSVFLAALVCFLISACNQIAQKPADLSSYPEGERQVIADQLNHVRSDEVTITARVKRVLPDDTRGNQHQRFLVELSNGTTILVAHNTDVAQRVPLNQGDIVTLHGEYIWNEKGGVIHWTHRSFNRHEGGYIELQGQRYQ